MNNSDCICCQDYSGSHFFKPKINCVRNRDAYQGLRTQLILGFAFSNIEKKHSQTVKLKPVGLYELSSSEILK